MPSCRRYPTTSLRRIPTLPQAEFASPRTAPMSETMWNERTRHLCHSSHSCNSGPTPPLSGSPSDNRQPGNPFKPLVTETVRVSEEWIGNLQSPDLGRSCSPRFAVVWCCLGSLTMSEHEYRENRDGEMIVVGSKLGLRGHHACTREAATSASPRPDCGGAVPDSLHHSPSLLLVRYIQPSCFSTNPGLLFLKQVEE